MTAPLRFDPSGVTDWAKVFDHLDRALAHLSRLLDAAKAAQPEEGDAPDAAATQVMHELRCAGVDILVARTEICQVPGRLELLRQRAAREGHALFVSATREQEPVVHS